MSTLTSPWTDETTEAFRAGVARFIREEFLPAQAAWRARGTPLPEDWRKAGAAGLLLPDIPADYGGGGGSFAHECVVVEELARAGVHFGCGIQSMVAHYLLAYGSEAQKRRWLPQMARGERVAAIAMTEANAGSDLHGIRTTARRDGDFYVIDGAKTFITNGCQADLVCLAVRTGSTAMRALSLVMVETAGLAGYRTGRPLEKLGMHGQDTCELFFDAVRVPAENLLGAREGLGLAQMMEQLAYERLSLGLFATVTTERAVATTSAYARERIVFGKPLMELQNTRFTLADCQSDARVSRVFIDHCIARYIAGELDGHDAALAKLWLTERECRVIDACLQLHGGYGYMTEYPIARMWADSRVHRIFAGSNETMKELIACTL